MRSLLVRVFFLMILSAPGTTVAGAQIKVTVEPADTTIALSDMVTVCITVDGPPADLKGYLIRVWYDATILSHVQTDPGDVLDGHLVTFIPNQTPPDTVGFDAAVLIGATNGPGTLGCFQFQGVAGGTSPITVTEVILRDSSNMSYSTLTYPGSVTVIPPTPVEVTTWGELKAGSRHRGF